MPGEPGSVQQNVLTHVSALQRIQDMEERRIERICEAMRSSAEAERKVLPVVSRCLDAMMDAAESIQPRMVSLLCVKVWIVLGEVFGSLLKSMGMRI